MIERVFLRDWQGSFRMHFSPWSGDESALFCNLFVIIPVQCVALSNINVALSTDAFSILAYGVFILADNRTRSWVGLRCGKLFRSLTYVATEPPGTRTVTTYILEAERPRFKGAMLKRVVDESKDNLRRDNTLAVGKVYSCNHKTEEVIT